MSLQRHLFSSTEKGQQLLTNIRDRLIAGAGGAVAIGLLLLLGQWSEHIMLMAPFGASCVLLFSVPNSPLSQPRNVIAGHLISTTVGLMFVYLLPASPVYLALYIALAVGISISLMALTGVTHPPAGADPIVVLMTQPGISFLLFPVFTGALLLVLIALFHHRFFTTITYPTARQTSRQTT